MGIVTTAQKEGSSKRRCTVRLVRVNACVLRLGYGETGLDFEFPDLKGVRADRSAQSAVPVQVGTPPHCRLLLTWGRTGSPLVRYRALPVVHRRWHIVLIVKVVLFSHRHITSVFSHRHITSVYLWLNTCLFFRLRDSGQNFPAYLLVILVGGVAGCWQACG